MTDAVTLPFLHTRPAQYASSVLVKYMNSVFENSLTENSTQIDQPIHIKIPLRDHQRTSASGLKIHETRMRAGLQQYDMCGNVYITRGTGGILGDPVGAGKSLTVLSYIAHLKENPTAEPNMSNTFIKSSDSSNYTIYTKKYDRTSPNNCKNLIIVPYTLVPQWRQYVNTQTSLKAHIIKNKADISSNIIPIQTADLTIVSNNMYGQFIDIVNENKLWWERVFYDEADSIKITSSSDLPHTLFSWYITASWPNITMYSTSIHRALLETIMNTDEFRGFHPDCVTWIAEYLYNHPSHYYSHYDFRSHNFLSQISNLANINTYVNVVLSSSDYYRRSFQMPTVTYNMHRCRRSAINHALAGLIDPQVQNLIDADDIDSALGILNLNTRTSTNLLQAVEHRYIRDISNIELTISYRNAMEYVSNSHKEEALTTLRSSKTRVETQLATFRERIQGLEGELCPICYDVPSSVIYSPCCNHLFCPSCILKCLRMNDKCPMCRTKVRTQDLTHINKANESSIVQTEQIPRKHEVLLKLLMDNPEGRFLVFSNYDNPFNALADDCEQKNIKYKILKGNSNTINKAINDFDKGKIRVLFMNSREVGMGLNIVSATHVILYHALRPEEEKQVVGRALRMGRIAPLSVHKLRHEGESS